MYLFFCVLFIFVFFYMKLTRTLFCFCAGSDEALKRLNEGFLYANNLGLCGVGFPFHPFCL
ncbi:hypothetical protein IC575_002143 [Cucumis melo]